MSEPLSRDKRTAIEMMLSVLAKSVQTNPGRQISAVRYVEDVDALLREVVRLEQEAR